MKYSIYQFDNSKEAARDMLYRPLNETQNKLTGDLYNKVWDGEIMIEAGKSEKEIVETIYSELSKELPIGFYGHALNVSDIIVLEDGQQYYIDIVGYKEVFINNLEN